MCHIVASWEEQGNHIGNEEKHHRGKQEDTGSEADDVPVRLLVRLMMTTLMRAI